MVAHEPENGGGPPARAPGPAPTTSSMELSYRYRRLELVMNVVRGALWIAVSWIPLQPIQHSVEAMAGKETSFSFTATVTIALSIALASGWALSEVRSQRRKRSVQDQRRTIDKLEEVIRALREGRPDMGRVADGGGTA